MLSSDDDPHLGQVAPHLIILPAPALQFQTFGRGRGALSTTTPKSVFGELFGDDETSGSDDSIASPTSSLSSESEDEAGVVAVFKEDLRERIQTSLSSKPFQ